MWAWATWWIPLLVLLGIWKHGVCRVPVTYTPMFWSLVFPLGMYALASLRLSLAADFPPLRTLSLAMAWIALGGLGGHRGGARHLVLAQLSRERLTLACSLLEACGHEGRAARGRHDHHQPRRQPQNASSSRAAAASAKSAGVRIPLVHTGS